MTQKQSATPAEPVEILLNRRLSPLHVLISGERFLVESVDPGEGYFRCMYPSQRLRSVRLKVLYDPPEPEPEPLRDIGDNIILGEN